MLMPLGDTDVPLGENIRNTRSRVTSVFSSSFSDNGLPKLPEPPIDNDGWAYALADSNLGLTDAGGEQRVKRFETQQQLQHVKRPVTTDTVASSNVDFANNSKGQDLNRNSKEIRTWNELIKVSSLRNTLFGRPSSRGPSHVCDNQYSDHNSQRQGELEEWHDPPAAVTSSIERTVLSNDTMENRFYCPSSFSPRLETTSTTAGPATSLRHGIVGTDSGNEDHIGTSSAFPLPQKNAQSGVSSKHAEEAVVPGVLRGSAVSFEQLLEENLRKERQSAAAPDEQFSVETSELNVAAVTGSSRPFLRKGSRNAVSRIPVQQPSFLKAGAGAGTGKLQKFHQHPSKKSVYQESPANPRRQSTSPFQSNLGSLKGSHNKTVPSRHLSKQLSKLNQTAVAAIPATGTATKSRGQEVAAAKSLSNITRKSHAERNMAQSSIPSKNEVDNRNGNGVGNRSRLSVPASLSASRQKLTINSGKYIRDDKRTENAENVFRLEDAALLRDDTSYAQLRKKSLGGMACTRNTVLPSELEILATQAQGKIALVDEQLEEVKKVRSMFEAKQRELEAKQRELEVAQKEWNELRETQRLALLTEREEALADVAAARKDLRRRQHRTEPMVERLTDQKRALETLLAEERNKWAAKELRFRRLVERLNDKVHVLDRRNTSLTAQLQQARKFSTEIVRTASTRMTQPPYSRKAVFGTLSASAHVPFGRMDGQHTDRSVVTAPDIRTSEGGPHTSSNRTSSRHNRFSEEGKRNSNIRRSTSTSGRRRSRPKEAGTHLGKPRRNSGNESINDHHHVSCDGTDTESSHYNRTDSDSSETCAFGSFDSALLQKDEALLSEESAGSRCNSNSDRETEKASNHTTQRRKDSSKKKKRASSPGSHGHKEPIQDNRPGIQKKRTEKIFGTAAGNVFESAPLPLETFREILRFDINKDWSPFDTVIKQLCPNNVLTSVFAADGSKLTGLYETLFGNLESRVEQPQLARPVEIKADGRQLFVYTDGRRETLFANGMRKVLAPSGWVLNFFTNGDIRGVAPDRRTHYYYFHEARVYSITKPDNLVFNAFADGQVDCRFPDGRIHVKFAKEGFLKQVDPSGTEHIQHFPDVQSLNAILA